MSRVKSKMYVDAVMANTVFLDKIDEVLPCLLTIVKDVAWEVWLFGSVARGTANAFSDLDLVVLIDTTEELIRKQVSMRIMDTDIREDTGFIPVDVIVRTKSYMFSDDIFPILVRQDKKVLWRCENV